MTKYLFLGGSADGQWHDVTFDGQPWIIRHPVENTLTDAGMITLGDYRDEVYHPNRLGGHSQRFTVYALDGWRGDDIIDRLINGSRTGEGSPDTQKLSNVQRVRVDDRYWNGDESKKFEARQIGNLARYAHENGLRFIDWPKCERTRLAYTDDSPFGTRVAQPEEKADLVEFRVSVLAVPR